MKRLFLLAALCIGMNAFSQQFISKGKIEFERKVNMHKQFGEDNEFTEELKKKIQQFDVTYFNLFFNPNESIYKPGKEVGENKPNFWGPGPAQDNIVYNNFNTKQFTSQKQVFETQYLIQDTLRKINWKLTNDTRKIAGFNCRKATGIMMDSVYIFAFYTDEILVSGGPEGFNGLPGMILGIAIPRISTTWFATKLELIEATPKDMVIPTKGRKTNIAALTKSLEGSLKDWGEWAQRNIWLTML